MIRFRHLRRWPVRMILKAWRERAPLSLWAGLAWFLLRTRSHPRGLGRDQVTKHWWFDIELDALRRCRVYGPQAELSCERSLRARVRLVGMHKEAADA